VYNKAVFLDRDGVINKPIIINGKPYPPKNFKEFAIFPRVNKALTLLKEAGYLLIIVTNQPDVGDKKQKKEIVEELHNFILKKLPIDHIETCFDRNSDCYKPKAGMFYNTAVKYNIDCQNSFMVGDRWVDIEAGRSAGCRTLFIDHGYSEALRSQPDIIVSSLYNASQEILKFQNKEI
jgi:D-glycero-D-manno-heptose 1,7-bisphosphate phosphatase